MQIPAVNSSPISTSSSSPNQPLHHVQNQASLHPSCRSNNPASHDTQCSTESEPTGNTQPKNATQKLSGDEQRQLAQLKVTDREVHAHEAAHIAAAGGLVRGGASFSYQAGADGRMYAVGGEVSIDTSAVAGNPQATIQKAQIIRAAALAPAQPSSADHAAAAAAGQLEAAARLEMATKKAEEQQTRFERDANQNTDTATDKPKRSDLIDARPDSGIDHYQHASQPNAPSDSIGQRVNVTA